MFEETTEEELEGEDSTKSSRVERIDKVTAETSRLARVDRLTFFLALVFLIALGTLAYKGLQPKAFDPLGTYRDQVVGLDGFVVDDNGNIVIPAPKELLPFETFGIEQLPVLEVKTGNETLPVHAQKCNASNVPVQIVGNTRWFETQPPGLVVNSGHGTRTMPAGCQDFQYNNPIPPDVLARVKTLANQGVKTTRWRIQGDETPISPDGNQFVVTRYFNSDEFVIRYTGPLDEAQVPSTVPAATNPVSSTTTP